MRYFWCWIFPPLGMLTCNRPGLAVVALALCCTIVGYLPAAIWSYLVTAEYYAALRNDKLVRAMGGSRRRRRRDGDERGDGPFDF